MNDVGHQIADATQASTEAFTLAVQRLIVGWDELMQWRVDEVHRLAAGARVPEEVLLSDWIFRFPPGDHESRDAFGRLVAMT